MSEQLVVGREYVLMPNNIVVTLLEEEGELRLKGVTAQGTVFCEILQGNQIRYTFRKNTKVGSLEPLPPKKEPPG